MAFLIIQNAQIAGFNDSVTEVENKLVIDVLMDHFKEGVNQDDTILLLNDKPLDVDSDDLLIQLKNTDELKIIREAKAVVGEVVSAATNLISGLLSFFIPDPAIPNEQGEEKSSSNNKFSGQTNLARTYQSWPVILGKITSYPDLIGEPVYEYVDNAQQIQQHFAVGFGTVNVENVKIGESKIGGFVGSSVTVRQPTSNNTTITDYRVAYSSSEIEGQILKGTGSGESAVSYDLELYDGIASLFSASSALVFVDKDAGGLELFTDYNAASGQFIMKISFLYSGELRPGEPNIEHGEGNGVVTAITEYANYYEIQINDYVGDTSEDVINITSASRQSGNQVGPITLAQQVEQLWVNLAFPRGLKANVDIQIFVEELTAKGGTPTGFTYTFAQTFNDNTLDEIYKTVKINGDLNGLSWYRYTVARTNAEADDTTTPDEVRVERVQGIRDYASVDFGDITLMEVKLASSGSVKTSGNTKINCDATAMMPTLNDSTLRTSRKFADAVLHLYTNYYKLDASQLNLVSLYAIQSKLDAENQELGFFDFSFDDGDINLQQRLETVCNAARVSTFLTNGQWQFVRDELREYPSGLISGRDIAKNGREYSITGGGSNPSDFDGVRLEYIDPSTNKKAYIRKQIVNGAFVDGESFNPKIVELAGCRNETQARNRAELEIRKLAYQVESLTETVLPSGSIFDKGDVILYSEQYESIAMDGEVLSVSGNAITTSELLTFESGETYKFYHTLIDGSLSEPKQITPIATSGSYRAFINDVNGIFVRDGSLGYNIQTGSRYLIVKDDEFDQTKWMLTEKTSSGKNTQLTLVNYDERVYDYD